MKINSSFVSFFLFVTPFIYLISYKIFDAPKLIEPLRFGSTLFLIFILVNQIQLNKIHTDIRGVFFLYLFIAGIFASIIRFELSNIFVLARYFLFFVITTIDLRNLSRYIFNRIEFLAFPTLAICLFQLITGDTYFANMVERVSGPYYMHSSGLSLFLIIINSILIYKIVVHKKNITRIFFLIISCYLLLRTGSRAGFLGFIFSLMFFNFKFLLKNKIRFLVFIIIIFYPILKIFNYLLSSGFFNRIIYLFKNGMFDASTNERIEIINRSFDNISPEQLILGIGPGYFDDFQMELVGEKIAAHNNLLLHLIEAGIFGLIFFIITLIWCFHKILKIKNSKRRMLAWILFFNIEVFGIINNNYFYFIPYSLFLIVFSHLIKNDYSYDEQNKKLIVC